MKVKDRNAPLEIGKSARSPGPAAGHVVRTLLDKASDKAGARKGGVQVKPEDRTGTILLENIDPELLREVIGVADANRAYSGEMEDAELNKIYKKLQLHLFEKQLEAQEKRKEMEEADPDRAIERTVEDMRQDDAYKAFYRDVRGWRISSLIKHKRQLIEEGNEKGWNIEMGLLEKAIDEESLGVPLAKYQESFTLELRYPPDANGDRKVAKVELNFAAFSPAQVQQFNDFIAEAYRMDKSDQVTSRIEDINDHYDYLVEMREQGFEIEDGLPTGSEKGSVDCDMDIQQLEWERCAKINEVMSEFQKDLSADEINDLMNRVLQYGVDNDLAEFGQAEGFTIDGLKASGAKINGFNFKDVLIRNSIFDAFCGIGMVFDNVAFLEGVFKGVATGITLHNAHFYGTDLIGTKMQKCVTNGNYGFHRGFSHDTTRINALDEALKYHNGIHQAIWTLFKRCLWPPLGLIWIDLRRAIFPGGKLCDIRNVDFSESEIVDDMKSMYEEDRRWKVKYKFSGAFFNEETMWDDEFIEEKLAYYSIPIKDKRRAWVFTDFIHTHHSNQISATTEDGTFQWEYFENLGISICKTALFDSDGGPNRHEIVFQVFKHDLDKDGDGLVYKPVTPTWYRAKTWELGQYRAELFRDDKAWGLAKYDPIVNGSIQGLKEVFQRGNRQRLAPRLMELEKEGRIKTFETYMRRRRLFGGKYTDGELANV